MTRKHMIIGLPVVVAAIAVPAAAQAAPTSDVASSMAAFAEQQAGANPEARAAEKQIECIWSLVLERYPERIAIERWCTMLVTVCVPVTLHEIQVPTPIAAAGGKVRAWHRDWHIHVLHILQGVVSGVVPGKGLPPLGNSGRGCYGHFRDSPVCRRREAICCRGNVIEGAHTVHLLKLSSENA